MLGYCLTDKEYQKYLNSPDSEDFTKTAWSRISTAPADKKGDFGEFFLYAILKYYFKFDEKLTKAKIKTARGDQIKGFDCAHFSLSQNDLLTLYLGEAKFHKSFSKALSSAIESIQSLSKITKIKDEISILIDHLDNESDKENYRNARSILNSGISLDKIKFVIPVLLTYDSGVVSQHTIDDNQFNLDLVREIRKKFKAINEKFNSPFPNFSLWIILLPFHNVEDVKNNLEKVQSALL